VRVNVEARCVAVAFSGGRDSTALLHATACSAAEHRVSVIALHVNHGLSAQADAWQQHGQALCENWAARGWPLRFVAQRLQTRPAKGDSVEAWARQARYKALRSMALAHGASLVLLAHHRRDQAETVLLQALRSAGTAGLAGMPRCIQRDGLTWARPWLDQPREAIEHYVRLQRLDHIEDESNADARFARNRLRLMVWPALAAAFPHAEAALAGTASWAQEATQCLGDLAAIDLAGIGSPAGLNLRDWQALSPARRSNALRVWLAAQMGASADASLVARLLAELPTTGPATWDTARGVLKRYRGLLRFVPPGSIGVPAHSPETTLNMRRAGTYRLPGWGGSLHAARVNEGGVSLAWLGHVELKPRRGAEQFQAGLLRPARSLKKQFQAAAVPPWQRDGPLVFSGGQLVFVPGLGIDARVVALPGQPQVALCWEPDSAH
jgi:tRNA(Ile)-lysidine synthase